MTHIIHPITDKRKRRPGDVLKDGEALHFNIALVRDSATGATRFLTDTERDISAQVDREHAAHDHKFQFMGDAAPKFDRDRAEFLARSRFGLHACDAAPSSGGSLAAARYMDGAKRVDAETQPKAAASSAPTHDAGGQAKPPAINALRSLRYQG